jgi:hypothetical protein
MKPNQFTMRLATDSDLTMCWWHCRLRLGQETPPTSVRHTPERLHRVHTRMNIDDGDDPKVRPEELKMEMWSQFFRRAYGG